MREKSSVMATLAIFSFISYAITVSAQETKWRVIKPGGTEFTVEFPGRPTRETRLLPDDNVLLKSMVHEAVVYDLVVDNVRYQVMSFTKLFKERDKFEGTLDGFAVGFERAF